MDTKIMKKIDYTSKTREDQKHGNLKE